MWFALAVLLADPPKPMPPLAAPPAAAPMVHLKLERAKWQDALDQVAGPLGLKVRLEADPPGSLTYADQAPRPAAEALDLLHGVLLDRGVALVRRGDVLLAVRLADQAHFAHAPFAPAEEIRQRKDSLMVFTTIRLHALLAADCKAELSGFLSPRGRMIDTALDNRVAVWDRCDNLRALLALLDVIDPPGQGNAAPLKAYRFQYGKASEAANIARELLGLKVEENEGLEQATSITNLVQQSVSRRSMRKVSKMFAPGMDQFFGGGGDGADPKDQKVRITVDSDRNTVFVHGPQDKLRYLDPLLKALDLPPAADLPPAVKTELRVFAVATGDGVAVAAKLKKALGKVAGMMIAGSKDKVIVKGPADRLEEVARMFERLNPASIQFAAFGAGDASALVLGRQLAKLFEPLPQAQRPLIAVSGGDDRIVVRGTAGQVAQIAKLMEQYSPQAAVEKVPRPAGVK